MPAEERITYYKWYNFKVKIPKPNRFQSIIYLTDNKKITQFKEKATSEHIQRWNLTHWMIIKLPGQEQEQQINRIPDREQQLNRDAIRHDI